MSRVPNISKRHCTKWSHFSKKMDCFAGKVGWGIIVKSWIRIREILIESKIISQEIHLGLEKRANDPHNPFLGYWDAQDWVKKEYGVEIKYQRIREYLIQHFLTKTKSPQKSHIKKDKQAEEAFLKTPKHVRTT